MKEIEINDKVRRDVKFLYDEILRRTRQVVSLTEELKMTNEQIFLNFLDDLNDISTKY